MKIGFIGNSCTGKTTLSTTLFYQLRKLDIWAMHYGDTGRDLCFDPELMDKSEMAALAPMFKQLEREATLKTKFPNSTLICERTPVDWYLYYLKFCLDAGIKGFNFSIEEWLKTYDKIYFLHDNLEYNTDGIRPVSDKLHVEMSHVYLKFFGKYGHMKNIKVVSLPCMNSRIAYMKNEARSIREARL